jgi:uncharacterized protein YoxC
MTKQILISQATARKLNESESVISGLKKQLDGLTKAVESLNQTIEWLCGTPEDVSTCKIRAVTVS